MQLHAETTEQFRTENSYLFDMLIDIADKLSDKVYFQFCIGEMDEKEMQNYSKKIETWARLTNELGIFYGKENAAAM